MAIIAEFDTDPLLVTIRDRHHAWHTAGGAHSFPPRQFPAGAANSGREFLQFHKDLMIQFFNWNNLHHAASPADIAAWTAVPAELKTPATGWPNPFGVNLADAEARISTNMPPFPNDDDLGIFIESSIHNWIHGAVAAATALNLSPAEQGIISGFHSVQSTYFYKIHGLVQYWWDRYLHPKSHIKEIADHKFIIADGKPHLKEILDRIGKDRIKEIKEKDKEKDIFEGKGFVEVPDPIRPGLDPAVINNLITRLADLEARAHVKRSPFIKPFLRPEVGEAVTKGETKADEKS